MLSPRSAAAGAAAVAADQKGAVAADQKGAVAADQNRAASADHDDAETDVNGIAKPRKKLSALFNKVADIAGRAAVTNAIKVTAVSAIAGAGASALTTLAVAATATGLGAALYSYGKDTFSAWRQARAAQDDSFRFVDTARLKKARTALLFGVAGGAFGAWLAGTETFQHGLELVKTYGGKMIESALTAFSGTSHAEVIPAAAPAAAITPDAETINERVAAAHEAVAAKPAPALSEDDIIARIDAAHGLLDAERQGLETILPETPKNALGKLWDAAMQSEQAKGIFMAQMLKADPDNLNSVTPQFLKDRAHDVLRLTDLPWQDRLSLARELAEEAQARGNRQAAGFLRDLAKLEDGTWKPRGLNIDGTGNDIAAPKAAPVETPRPQAVVKPAAPVVPSAETVADPTPISLPEQPPVKTVIVERDPVTGTISEKIVDSSAPDATAPAPAGEEITAPAAPAVAPVAETHIAETPVAEKPAAAFERAAICTVKMAGDLSAAETFCEVSKSTMRPGDYISFVAADNVRINVSTTLVEGSVEVPTDAFLHEKVVGEGVARLNQSVIAQKPAMR